MLQGFSTKRQDSFKTKLVKREALKGLMGGNIWTSCCKVEIPHTQKKKAQAIQSFWDLMTGIKKIHYNYKCYQVRDGCLGNSGCEPAVDVLQG